MKLLTYRNLEVVKLTNQSFAKGIEIALRMNLMLLKHRVLSWHQRFAFICFSVAVPKRYSSNGGPKFDENSSKYAKFMSTFEQTVDAADLTASKKLLYLVQHC